MVPLMQNMGFAVLPLCTQLALVAMEMFISTFAKMAKAVLYIAVQAPPGL